MKKTLTGILFFLAISAYAQSFCGQGNIVSIKQLRQCPKYQYYKDTSLVITSFYISYTLQGEQIEKKIPNATLSEELLSIFEQYKVSEFTIYGMWARLRNDSRVLPVKAADRIIKIIH